MDVQVLELVLQAADGWYGRILIVSDTEVDASAVRGIVLVEGRGQAVVKIGIKAFDGAYDGNMRSFGTAGSTDG